MTLRETVELLLLKLQDRASLIGVGEDAIQLCANQEMPSAAPFVWIYAEPGEPLLASRALELARGKITIFAGASAGTATEAMFQALEFCERSYRIALDTLPEPEFISFQNDAVYSDIAVVFCEITYLYEISEVL